MVSQTLVDVILLLPVAVIALTIGIAVALGSSIAHDKRKEKRIMNMVLDSESWCQRNCRLLEECYSNNEDPDDAWKVLDNYCCECPMAKAIDVWEQEKEKQKRSEQK